MASYQIPVLECFNFAKPDEWPKWIQRFERFQQASGVAAKSEESQVNTLIYSTGEKANDIFQCSIELSADDSKKYNTVKGKFETHFMKQRNTIFERAKLNSCKGEAVDDFIVDLYTLAEPCQYGNLWEEMIRDRIVVGIRDGRLAEKLQLNATLTLEKAVTEARQSEAVKKQQSTVRERGAGQPAGVSEVRRQHGYKPKHYGEQAKPSASRPRRGQSIQSKNVRQGRQPATTAIRKDITRRCVGTRSQRRFDPCNTMRTTMTMSSWNYTVIKC